MHLADVRHRINRQQGIYGDVRIRFFARFAACTGFRRLMLFEISCGQRPEIFSWFDRAPTQQDVVAIRDNSAHDYFWIGIVNVFALRADMTLVCVSIRNAPNEVRSG